MENINIFKQMLFYRNVNVCDKNNVYSDSFNLSFSFDMFDDFIDLEKKESLKFLDFLIEANIDFIIYDDKENKQIIDINKFKENCLDLYDKYIYLLITEKNQNILEKMIKSFYEEKNLIRPIDQQYFCFEFNTLTLQNKTIVLKNIVFFKPIEYIQKEKEEKLKNILIPFISKIDNDYNKFIKCDIEHINGSNAILNVRIYENDQKFLSADRNNSKSLNKNKLFSLFNDNNVDVLTHFYTILKKEHPCSQKIEIRKTYEGFMMLMVLKFNLKNI